MTHRAKDHGKTLTYVKRKYNHYLAYTNQIRAEKAQSGWRTTFSGTSTCETDMTPSAATKMKLVYLAVFKGIPKTKSLDIWFTLSWHTKIRRALWRLHVWAIHTFCRPWVKPCLLCWLEVVPWSYESLCIGLTSSWPELMGRSSWRPKRWKEPPAFFLSLYLYWLVC